MDKINTRKNLIDNAKRRFATKEFDPSKNIEKEDWYTILEVARLSASSFGYEPWKIISVDNKKIREELKDFTWGASSKLDAADKFIIVLARKDIRFDSEHVKKITTEVYGREYDSNSARSQLFKTFQEIHFDLNDERKNFDWACKQTYIMMANMMNAAIQLGIDTCPIEGFDREKAEEYLEKKAYIDRKKWGVSYMLCFGYKAMDVPEKFRQKLEDIYTEI